MQHVLQFWYCNQPSPLSDVASALFDHANNFPIYMGSCNHNVHIHFLFSLSCLAIGSETSHLSLPQFRNYFKKLTKTATKLFSATWRFGVRLKHSSAHGFSWSLCAAGIEPSSCNGPSALPTPLPASLAYFWELWVNSSYKLLKCQRS